MDGAMVVHWTIMRGEKSAAFVKIVLSKADKDYAHEFFGYVALPQFGTCPRGTYKCTTSFGSTVRPFHSVYLSTNTFTFIT